MKEKKKNKIKFMLKLNGFLAGIYATIWFVFIVEFVKIINWITKAEELTIKVGILFLLAALMILGIIFWHIPGRFNSLNNSFDETFEELKEVI